MSPKSKAQFEAIRQKSIATIKEVALELFARNGYHSTTISQITKEAGISKGLVYNYFSSKEELLNTIILEAVELGERLMESLLDSTPDPYEQLVKLLEASVNMVKANLHYWKLLTALAFQTDVLKGLEPILKRKQKVAIDIIIQLFERMGFEDPEKEAWLFGALLDGIMIHYMQLEEEYPLDEMEAFILERYEKIYRASQK